MGRANDGAHQKRPRRHRLGSWLAESARRATANEVGDRSTAPPGEPQADVMPQFAILDRHACERVLARNVVGRLAYPLHDWVDIQPVHYVYADGWLYGRTSPGSKVLALRHGPWVAFEVDEIEGTFEWRSVVARGTFYPLSPDGPESEASAWERAIDLLEAVIPATGTGVDPVPFRTVVFRIYVHELSGRSATLRTGRARSFTRHPGHSTGSGR